MTNNKNKQKKLIVIDGPAVLYRSWYALPRFTYQGKTLNAVYGLISLIFKLIKQESPDYLSIAFDTKELTFRHKIYPKYKAGRPIQPQEFYDQIPLSQKLIQRLGIQVLVKPGHEADDLISALNNLAQSKKIFTLVVTGDQDLFQLVNKLTHLYYLKQELGKNRIYGPKETMEKFKLKPSQLINFKALRGDPSDNLPGVRNIGSKIALDLIQEFGTIEKIYQIVENPKTKNKIKNRVRKLLLDSKDQAILTKKLVLLENKVPGVTDIQKSFFQIDFDKAEKVLQGFGFKSLVKRLNQLRGDQKQLF